jgi:Ran GTPase-activating protein (RanGAP) involved in mRNA processing and transport
MSGGKKAGKRRDGARNPGLETYEDRDPKADLPRMRGIIEKQNRFALLDGKDELYAAIVDKSRSHVALLRTSKPLNAAVQKAGKGLKVQYNVDTAKFNDSTDPLKVGGMVEGLRLAAEQYNVDEIKIDDLSSISFGVSLPLGVQLNRIAPLLEKCAGLTSLSLRNNGLRDIEAIGHGLAHCTGLTRLDLSTNKIVWREGTLAGCTALRDLNLYENWLNEESTVDLSHNLSYCTALTQLDLSRTNINSVAGMTSLVNSLKRCTGLTRLNLSQNTIRSATITILAHALPELPALVHLDLSRNFMEFNGWCQLGYMLGNCTSLESLNVSHNRVKPPSCRYVNTFTQALPLCPRLKHLDLSVNDLGENLQALTLGNLTDDLVRVLPRCLALESLRLYASNVSDALASLLASTLPECLALRELDLQMNTAIGEKQRVELRTAWAAVRERDAQLLLLE